MINPDDMCEEIENEEERYCHQMLAMLQESYVKAAKPYMDRLVRINAMQPVSILITREQLAALQFSGALPPVNAAK